MADAGSFLSSPTVRICREIAVLTTGLMDRLLMMDPEQGLYFELDAIGTEIWQRLETPVLLADLVAGLARDYQAPVAEVERDVLALLHRMADHRLIVPC